MHCERCRPCPLFGCLNKAAFYFFLMEDKKSLISLVPNVGGCDYTLDSHDSFNLGTKSLTTTSFVAAALGWKRVMPCNIYRGLFDNKDGNCQRMSSAVFLRYLCVSHLTFTLGSGYAPGVRCVVLRDNVGGSLPSEITSPNGSGDYPFEEGYQSLVNPQYAHLMSHLSDVLQPRFTCLADRVVYDKNSITSSGFGSAIVMDAFRVPLGHYLSFKNSDPGTSGAFTNAGDIIVMILNAGQLNSSSTGISLRLYFDDSKTPGGGLGFEEGNFFDVTDVRDRTQRCFLE